MKSKKPRINIGTSKFGGNMKRDYGFYGHMGAPKRQSIIQTKTKKCGA